MFLVYGLAKEEFANLWNVLHNHSQAGGWSSIKGRDSCFAEWLLRDNRFHYVDVISKIIGGASPNNNMDEDLLLQALQNKARSDDILQSLLNSIGDGGWCVMPDAVFLPDGGVHLNWNHDTNWQSKLGSEIVGSTVDRNL